MGTGRSIFATLALGFMSFVVLVIRIGKRSANDRPDIGNVGAHHPQFTQVSEQSVAGSPASCFLDRDFADSGIRSL